MSETRIQSEAAQAHRGNWVKRVQRDTRMVLSVVAREGLVANQRFLEPVLGGLLETIPGSVHIQVGQGLEQVALVEGVSVYARGVGTR